VILYMLVCGKPPFQEANDSETLIRIMDCHYVTPDHLSASCVELVFAVFSSFCCPLGFEIQLHH